MQLAGVRDGQNLRLYLDGQLIGEETGAAGAVNNTGRNLFFGRFKDVGPIYSHISIDDVRIYDLPLHPTDVKALQEEAAGGWTLMEKFDNKRLRLKRPVSARDRDSSLDFNPYRTMTPSMAVATREANRNAWFWLGVIVFVVVIAFIMLSN